MQKPHSINLSFLAFIGVLYSFQSILGAITFQGMPAVFRQSGIPPIQIGFIYLLMLPWIFKFIWAAPLETWRQKKGRRTNWLFLVVNSVAIVMLLLLTLTTPDVGLYFIFILLAIIAILSATVDTALDGFAIKESNALDKNWVNVMQIGGGYLGSIVGGSLFLLLVGRYNWKFAVYAMVVLLLMMLCYVLFQQQSVKELGQKSAKQSLQKTFASKQVQYGIFIVVIAQLGLRLAQGMTMPFFIDYGITLTQLGVIGSIGGATASLIAVFLTGLWVTKKGPGFVLISLLAVQISMYFAFYYFSEKAELTLLQASFLLLSNSACVAASFVALYNLLMRLTSPEQAGVDFSLLQGVDTAIALIAGVISGALVQYLGYQSYFLLCALASFSALVALPLLNKSSSPLKVVI
ncbi:MFS transporter [Marinomonas rhizomae]|uniref:MFS transporter (Putative signal transducer) n=1 Tax=Marinomonas rhizomae TaxID=491948 RepID=A0A366JEX7_9GAMM|nr:MFS transporter [Marinomonas rhizomae]RBP85010.1 MFS transporter (putative signal transducer) [Marinomonas rhizomae]RNF76125.1 MFS transporter [Marinomonas rhizomae]